jgi:hypothetical protein
VIEHLGQLDFLHAKENVVLLGPPDLGSHCTSSLIRWSIGPARRREPRSEGLCGVPW